MTAQNTATEGYQIVTFFLVGIDLLVDIHSHLGQYLTVFIIFFGQ